MSDPIQMLTALALTPDTKLAGFVRRHLSKHPEIDIGAAKALLSAITDALAKPHDGQLWAKLRAAQDALGAPEATIKMDEEDGGTGTLAIDDEAPAHGTLPFSPAHTVAEAPPAAATPWEHRAQAGGTMATDAAGSASALPFGAHELTLEQYAALCAESARDPSRTAEINERYGLGTPGARGRVDLAWQKRLAKDSELRERWRALFEELKNKP